VFALEEPEVFLHPHRARYFAAVLRSLTEKGNQVFLTTHSPIFVALDQPESVAIVRRTEEDGTTVRQTSRAELADNDRRSLRLLTEFDTQRNELFFARCVLLVEGATEKVALPLLFRGLGYDVNRLGISVVDVGGKTKLPLFASVCSALKIPFVALVDHDIKAIDPSWSTHRQDKERERNAEHKRWNEDIETRSPAGRIFWMMPDFETECGLPQTEAEKIDRAMERFSAAAATDIPDVLRPVIAKVLELAR
jgi:CRISPR-associated exonuclease Cas4